MTSSQLEKLLFSQGEKCFFCKKKLAKNEASIEHLVAKANGGSNVNNENCVACCKEVNSLLGSLSLKQKIEIILNQEGNFKCPSTSKSNKPKVAVAQQNGDLALVVESLKKRGDKRPKKLKTLKSTIVSMHQLSNKSDKHINQLIEQLVKNNKISISAEEKIDYKL
jgi:F0F1-type ATP synthase delta subunit